jgi:hypothetical protein
MRDEPRAPRTHGHAMHPRREGDLAYVDQGYTIKLPEARRGLLLLPRR